MSSFAATSKMNLDAKHGSSLKNQKAAPLLVVSRPVGLIPVRTVFQRDISFEHLVKNVLVNRNERQML